MLGVHPIGIGSNFFDVGGYSLGALRLFAKINKAFDRSLPVVTIFSSPTIEQLATLIRGRALNTAPVPIQGSGIPSKINSAIVPMQPDGSAAPVYIIHGDMGDILGFHRLAMLIGTDHPIYGIEAQSLLAGQPALIRLEDQAAYYLSEIRKIQPKGPYYLLGYCFGGKIAFEIAHQLHASGERVELLGLLDAYLRDDIVHMQRNDSMRMRLNRSIASLLGHSSPLSFGGKVAYLPKKLIGRTLGCVYGIAASFGIRTVPSFMKNTENISKVAAKNYCLRPWPGPVTLFRASIQADTRLPRDLGWTRLAEGGVEVYEVPGDHNLPFEEPGVRRLAERLRARLERSDEAMAQFHESEYSAK